MGMALSLQHGSGHTRKVIEESRQNTGTTLGSRGEHLLAYPTRMGDEHSHDLCGGGGTSKYKELLESFYILEEQVEHLDLPRPHPSLCPSPHPPPPPTFTSLLLLFTFFYLQLLFSSGLSRWEAAVENHKISSV